MADHEGYAMLGVNEVVRAYRARVVANAAPPIYVPFPEPDDRPAPDELAEILERMKSTLRPRVAEFQRAADVLGTEPATARCQTCTLDYRTAENPKGCPRCRMRVLAWRGSEGDPEREDAPSLDDVIEAGLEPQEDDTDDFPF